MSATDAVRHERIAIAIALKPRGFSGAALNPPP
jgi:hypothetical protein